MSGDLEARLIDFYTQSAMLRQGPTLLLEATSTIKELRRKVVYEQERNRLDVLAADEELDRIMDERDDWSAKAQARSIELADLYVALSICACCSHAASRRETTTADAER